VCALTAVAIWMLRSRQSGTRAQSSKARAGVTAVMRLVGNVEGLSARMHGSGQVDFH